MSITTMDGIAAAIAAGQRLVIQKASVTSVAGFYYTLWNAAPNAGSLAIGNIVSGVIPTDATAGAPTINAFTGANTGYLLTFDASNAQAVGVETSGASGKVVPFGHGAAAPSGIHTSAQVGLAQATGIAEPPTTEYDDSEEIALLLMMLGAA